jgi:hypothetical protein
VSLGGVSARFLVGVGAWLLGAGAATGGSLLAVSLLGQSLAPAPSQQLIVPMVNPALAGEAAEAAGATPTPPASPTPSPTRHHKVKPTAAATPEPAEPTVLTSSGGSVVAECQAAGAYLVSWNANSGFQASRVVRGPTATAKATFDDWQRNRSVVMVITCANGAPSATSYSHLIDE